MSDSEWIPTSDRDRLPKEGVRILVYRTETESVESANRWQGTFFVGDVFTSIKEFSHWRPLPPGPSVQK